MNIKDAMSKTTDSHIYKHCHNEHWWCNEQDIWIQHQQALAECTWKMLWARQLTPTAISTIRLNKKDAMSKTTDSHSYKHYQIEQERSNEQDNWLAYLQALEEWTWKKQWARQLIITSTSTSRMNKKDEMVKSTDSYIYKHWKNEHERCNEQDNWLPHIKELAEWTCQNFKKCWKCKLYPTSATYFQMKFVGIQNYCMPYERDI